MACAYRPHLGTMRLPKACPPSQSRFQTLVWVVVAFAVLFVRGAAGGKCLDGSAGLTRELYEAGDPSKYADVTCIPQEEFQDYHGDVTLDKGLDFLTSIGGSAFESFNGILTIKGSFPLLATIGDGAFDYAGNADSVIELVGGLPALTSIGDSAFWSFSGTLTIKGSFPLLATIGQGAFSTKLYQGVNADSMIELVDGLPALTSIGDSAFWSFSGTLTIKGSFPLLATIGDEAFDEAGNADSVIELVRGGLPALTSIGDFAFSSFNGILTINDGLPALTSIGENALSISGIRMLTIKGSFPLLATIGYEAFDYAGNADSVIELVDGLPALTSIGDSAFRSFSGTLTIKGSFPLLATIGDEAFGRGHFDDAGNADSVIELVGGLPALTSIGDSAFRSFSGTLTIKGSFPLLATIGDEAFDEAGNADSSIFITCTKPTLQIGTDAIKGFKGSDTIQKAVSGYVPQGVWLSNYKSEYTAQLKQRFEYVDRKNATFAYTDSSYTIPVLTFIEAVYSSTGKCQGVTFPANTVFKLTVPIRTSGDGGKECSNGEALGVECRSANDSPTCIAVSTSVAWHEACPYTCAICTHSNDIISKFWNKWSTTTTTTFPSATSEQLSPSDSGSGSEPLSPPVSGPFSGSFYGSGPFSGSFYGSGFFSGSGPFSPQPTPDNDKLIRINASTGAIQVDPLPSGTYTGLQVVATLPDGESINLTDSWNLTVIPRPAFSVTWKYDRDPVPPAVLNAEYKYNAGKDYIVSEQVDVKENNKIFNILDGASSIIYRTAGGSRKLPPGLKLDLGSGRIYGAPIKAGVFHVDILAEDLDNEGYKVKVHRGNAPPRISSVDIRVEECTNLNTCNNHGKCDHLEDLYDGISTCRCNFGYAGLACETPSLAYYIVAILFGLGGIPAAIYVYKLRKRAMAPVDFEAKLQELIDAGDIEVPTDDQEHHQAIREIKRSCLTLVERLGKGAFGEVWKGVLDESKTKQGGAPGYLVAAKTVLADASDAATEELLQEAIVMRQVGRHPNLVSIIGTVTVGTPLVLIILFCEHGSFLDLLKHHLKQLPITGLSGKRPLAVKTKLEIAAGIVHGMAHLVKNLFIHRDLAARNCLIATGMVAKVADFGLSRSGVGNVGSEYYKSQAGVFPIRWTAPEAMATMKFSASSDVWSFGIVLLEAFSDGAKPYREWKTEVVMEKVMGGHRAPKPIGCPDKVYAVMLQCWETDPNRRPTFEQLANTVDQLVAHGHFLSTAVDVTGPAAPAASACPPKIEYLKALAPITSGVGLGHQTAAIAPRQVQIDTSGGKSVGLYLNDRPNGRGLVVRGCIPGGQAEKTGQIFSNDVVTHVNGTDITGMTMAEVGPLIATTTTPTFTLVAPEGASNLSAGWECKSTPEGSKNDAGVEYKESQSSMYQRVVTDGADQSDASSAAFLKQALLSTPLLSLHEACKLATVHCQQDLQKEATAALEFASALLQSPTLGPKYAALGFSVVDVAVVHVYTQETELYPCMNGALGGWGKPDPDGMRGLTHYMGIIKLLFNALEKLPPMSGEEVFRGVRNVKLDVLLKGKGVGDVLIWGAFTSTSVDADTLHDPVFFGFEPGLGERVIFHIRNETGVRIQELSEKGCLFGYADEDEEEVLLKPGSKFVIDAITSLADDITQVQMHEVVEDEEHLELKKKNKKKTKNGAFVTRSPSGNDIGGATNTAATWSCAACTFDNTAIATACAMCDTPKVASIPNQLQSSGLNPASAADGYTAADAADAASSTAATTALTYTQGLVEGSAYASASPSASTTDFNDYQLCMYQRVLIPEVDQSDEDGVALLRNSLPDTPLVSLHEACRRASVHCVSSLQREATAALEFASALLESPVAGPKYATLGLTVVDVAVVNLYTQETPLYLFMNGALGGWGRDGKQGIMHYMCIIKLLFNAIKKLTPLSGETVFRGVYNVTLDVLLKGNGVGDTLVWGAFTSTSVDADTLHEFINIEPGLAGCVVFHIKNETGVRIQELSNKGSFFGYADEDEEEVLLKPGSAFVIDAINSLSSNVMQVHMHEIIPEQQQQQQQQQMMLMRMPPQLPHVPSNGNASSSIGLVNMTHAVGSGYVAGLQEFGGYYDDVDDGYEGIGRITSETTLL